MANKTKSVKLKLDQLLRMKEDLENSIRNDEQSMRKNNSRPIDEEAQINFKEIKQKYELKLEQLIIIKEAIRDGNSELNKEDTTNDTNIYLLSNLNRRKAFLNSLNTFEGERTTMKSNGKLVKFGVKYSNKNVVEELKEIEKQIRDLENKLSSFNHSTEVKVDLFVELELI